MLKCIDVFILYEKFIVESIFPEKVSVFMIVNNVLFKMVAMDASFEERGLILKVKTKAIMKIMFMKKSVKFEI